MTFGTASDQRQSYDHTAPRMLWNRCLGFLPALRACGERQPSCNYSAAFPSKNGPFRWIRQEFFENGLRALYGLEGAIVESWEYFMAPVNLRFESGDRFEFKLESPWRNAWWYRLRSLAVW